MGDLADYIFEEFVEKEWSRPKCPNLDYVRCKFCDEPRLHWGGSKSSGFRLYRGGVPHKCKRPSAEDDFA